MNNRKKQRVVKKFLALTVLLGVLISCGLSYGATKKEQYFSQVFKYMEQFANSQKPKYLGYEYFSDFMGDPMNIYSLVFKNAKTSVVRNFYDRSLRESGAWPYFRTTDPAYSVGGIKVGSSTKTLTKNSAFYKNSGSRYSSDYEGFVLSFYYNKKGIITCLELVYDDEPVASKAMDFVNGKIPANVVN